MSFAAPVLLVALLVVPAAVAGHLWLERRRVARASAWASTALLPNMAPAPPSWQRHLPTALLLAGVALLLVGFARPKTSFHVKSEEATVVVVLDVSGSMAANDVRPSRLVAARAAALRLVDTLPRGYRMAVVAFSDHSAVVAPPTHDLDHVRSVIAHVKSGPQGTALAGAVATAVKVGASVKGTTRGKRPPAVVVLFSDGGQTAGRLTPKQAAQRARKAFIPVFTALVGTPNGVVEQQLKGGYTERFQVPADPTVLQLLARESGGGFAPSLAAFDGRVAYRELGSRAGSRRKTVEVTAAAAAGGLAFMLAGALLSGMWFRRLP